MDHILPKPSKKPKQVVHIEDKTVRRKKKDKFCGLNIEAVTLAQGHNVSNSPKIAPKDKTLNTRVSRKKQNEIKKKKIGKLSKILNKVNVSVSAPKQNKLINFLNFLS